MNNLCSAPRGRLENNHDILQRASRARPDKEALERRLDRLLRGERSEREHTLHTTAVDAAELYFAPGRPRPLLQQTGTCALLAREYSLLSLSLSSLQQYI